MATKTDQTYSLRVKVRGKLPFTKGEARKLAKAALEKEPRFVKVTVASDVDPD